MNFLQLFSIYDSQLFFCFFLILMICFSPFSGDSSSVSDLSKSVSELTASPESSDLAQLFFDFFSLFFLLFAGEFFLDLVCLYLFLDDDGCLLLLLCWDLPLSLFMFGQSLLRCPGFLQCQQGLLQSFVWCPLLLQI